MSQENVDKTYRARDAFNRRDLDSFLTLMDEDTEAVSRLAPMEGGYHGHLGIRRWWANILETIPDFTIGPADVQDLGELTLVSMRNRGHGAASDAPFEETLWMVMRWRDGKCTWWGAFQSEAEALDAAGLPNSTREIRG